MGGEGGRVGGGRLDIQRKKCEKVKASMHILGVNLPHRQETETQLMKHIWKSAKKIE